MLPRRKRRRGRLATWQGRRNSPAAQIGCSNLSDSRRHSALRLAAGQFRVVLGGRRAGTRLSGGLAREAGARKEKLAAGASLVDFAIPGSTYSKEARSACSQVATVALFL